MEILRYFNLVSITRHCSAMALPSGKRRLEDVSCETSCFEMVQLLDICGLKYILEDEICVSLRWESTCGQRASRRLRMNC